MSTESPHPSHRAITLTDRPPVRIAVAEWPTIAQAYRKLGDAELALRVRQHADGRVIVYGKHSDRYNYDARDGVVLEHPVTWTDVIAAIHRTADRLKTASDDPRWDDVARRCIADLPPEVL